MSYCVKFLEKFEYDYYLLAAVQCDFNTTLKKIISAQNDFRTPRKNKK